MLRYFQYYPYHKDINYRYFIFGIAEPYLQQKLTLISVRYTCGESSSQNCSYFESPGYPDYYPPGGGTVPPTVTPLPQPTMMPTMPPPEETTTEPITDEPTTPTMMPTETFSPPTTEPQGEEITPDPRKDLFIHHMKPMFRQNMDDVYNCVFMIYKTSSDVRQMRIDFEDLEVNWE